MKTLHPEETPVFHQLSFPQVQTLQEIGIAMVMGSAFQSHLSHRIIW